MASTFESLDTSHLVDLLAKKTAEYTACLKDGTDTQEFQDCKAWIKILQKEIKARKVTDTNTTVTDPNIEFKQEDQDATDAV